MALDLSLFVPDIDTGRLPVLVLVSLLRLDPSVLSICKKKDVLKLKWLIEGAASSRIERVSMQSEKWYHAFQTRVKSVKDPLAHSQVSTEHCLSSSSGRLRVADLDLPSFRPFCYSRRWCAQRRFYQQSSLAAWTSNRIPSQISSNFFVASQYMDRIVQKLSYRNDTKSDLRVVIVEIGAGHGIMSISMALLLLEASLADRLERTDAAVTVEVICTDFHYAAFASLLELPYVSRLVEQGLLTFATLNAPSSSESSTKDGGAHSLHTLMSHRRREASSGGGGTSGGYDAVFIVAQYAFDSFPCHLYSTDSAGGGVKEIGVCYLEEREETRAAEVKGLNSSKKRSHGAMKDRPEALVSRSVESEKETERSVCEQAFLDTLEGDRHVKENALLAVPFGVVPLVQTIRDCFPLRDHEADAGGGVQSFYTLLAGDYFCDYDHKQWKAPLLAASDHSTESSSAGSVRVLRDSHTMEMEEGEPSDVENVLHVPYINPIAEATAIPVSLTALHWLWCYAMGSRVDEMASFSHVEDYSHLLASSFSTVQLSYPVYQVERGERGEKREKGWRRGGRERGETADESSVGSIGPHDVHVLREYLSSTPSPSLTLDPHRSLQFLVTFLNMNDSLDVALFLQFRWILLQRWRQYLSIAGGGEEEGGVVTVMDLLQKAVFRHVTVSAVSARRELCLLMQWLLAFHGLCRQGRNDTSNGKDSKDGSSAVVVMMDLLVQKLRGWIEETQSHMSAQEAFLLAYLASKHLLSSPRERYLGIHTSSASSSRGDIAFMAREGGLGAARTNSVCHKQYTVLNRKRRKQLLSTANSI